MKNKVILAVAISAIATLSFTYASTKGSSVKKQASSSKSSTEAPAGGFVSEDKF